MFLTSIQKCSMSKQEKVETQVNSALGHINDTIVCGGNAESAGVQSNCYTLDKDTVQWTLLTDALPANYRYSCFI